jgi:hypothetical protein
MDEIWKDIKGYEEMYQISNTGKVRSLDRKNALGRKIKGRVITINHNKKHNGMVRLSKDGIKKSYYVNRLVWLTFNNKELNEEIYVYRYKGNKNNNITNLKIAYSLKEVSIEKVKINNSYHSVKCITNNKVFESVTVASKYNDYIVTRQGIYTCCKGRQKTAGKLKDGTPLIWEYID